ncbi:MAG: (Fe-S)-binding protein [Candidatus Limnocylindria bacterium]
MPPSIPFYPLIVVPIGFSAYLFWRRLAPHLAMLRSGRPLDRSDHPWQRVKGLGIFVLGQQRLLRDPGPGLMHFFIFWGFVVLLATTGNYFTNGLVQTVLGWPLGGVLWSSVTFFANLFIGLILLSLAYAAYRRTVERPARLALSRDAYLILGMIAGVVLTELAADALRYIADPAEASRAAAILAAPAATVLAAAGVGPATAATAYGFLAWAHIGVVLGFIVHLPRSKHLHIFTSEPNVYFRNLEPRGALRPMDLDAEPAPGEEVTFGARTLRDLTWRHLLDPLTCTECGRCMEFCPASMTGKTLSPKHFMEGLRDQIAMAETALAAAAGAQRAAKGGAAGGVEASDASLQLARDRAREALELPIVDHAIPEEAIWQCTTCGWCVEGCPVLIEHVDTIVEVRRNLVLEESRFPKELNAAFRNMETAGNPWGQPRSARLDWARGLDVQELRKADGALARDAVLYWVGCAGAFDERNRKVVRAIAQLLAQAEVPFVVLGSQETCSGDPARRAGNEYLYQMLAEENVRTLGAAHDEHGVGTIVASCPHCFNTIRNEYPQFGLAGVDVLHHTQLLDRLVRDGRLRPDTAHDAVVAYHDACYLGRYNKVYDPGRRLVEAVPGQQLGEMALHHDRGMCCGAGGARMWMEEREGQRINHRRVQQALELEPDAIATACPFCLIMLRDGATDLGRPEVEVRDVAELLADATGAWNPGAVARAATPERPAADPGV